MLWIDMKSLTKKSKLLQHLITKIGFTKNACSGKEKNVNGTRTISLFKNYFKYSSKNSSLM